MAEKADMERDQALYPPVPAFSTGLKCQCPRCGQGKLFDGLLKPAARCVNCGLDYSFEDSGDGPTVFVMLLVGLIIVGGAIYLEFNYSPPVWVHFIIWPPMLAVVGLWTLRVTKSLLIVLQYQNQAHEGELVEPPSNREEL